MEDQKPQAPENIKTKINIHWEGESNPFASVEDFNKFKLAVKIHEKYETPIKTIWVEGKEYEIVEIEISSLPETSDLHLQYGIDSTLYGEPLPYNFRVSIYIKK